MDRQEKTIIFIFGCQRSGTSITSASLSRLKNVKSYSETDNELTDADTSELPHRTIRLNPLEDVKNKIEKNQHKYVVVKPLVESQHAKKILKYFPNSKALWLYRDYHDVVNSMIAKWGEDNGVSHLNPILKGSQFNWRSELLPKNVRQIIIDMCHKNNITGADGWGLFWYARNSLFFAQDLSNNPNCLVLKYENLVSSPEYLISAFAKLGIADIDIASVWNYKTTSIGKGSSIYFSEEIDELLKSMMNKLEHSAFKIDK